MLEEIRKIYEYHDWANKKILDAANALTSAEREIDLGGSFSTFMKTLSHIVMVEFLFIGRWKQQPPREQPEWETLDQISSVWQSIETERNEFLAGLSERSLSGQIHYADTRGREVSLELWQAIFQCINHSTLHRGQLIDKLRKLGKIPPLTDFVLFSCGREK
jgi:uncharacterized damage-inducible protein DinB